MVFTDDLPVSTPSSGPSQAVAPPADQEAGPSQAIDPPAVQEAGPSQAITPPAVDQTVLNDLVSNPKKLLELIKSDFLQAHECIKEFSRTQVRLLLENAEKSKFNINYELFKLLEESYKPGALKLNLSGLTIEPFDLNLSGMTNEPLRSSKFWTKMNEMAESKMLTFKNNLLSPDTFVYPVFVNGKEINLGVFQRGAGRIVFQDQVIDTTTYNNEVAEQAYRAFEQRKAMLKRFPEMLTTFYKKSNRQIDPNEFSGIMASLAKTTEFLTSTKNWALLAELMLRLGEGNWLNEIKGLGNGGSPEELHCVRIAHERYFYYHNKDIFFSTGNTLLGYRAHIINSMEEKNRFKSIHILRSCLNTLGSSATPKALFTNEYNKAPSPTKQFFDLVFFEQFSVQGQRDFPWLFDWLRNLDLTAEIEAGNLDLDKFSEIIDWEMFAAMFHLLNSLTPAAAAGIIFSLSEQAWRTIHEFSGSSQAMLNRMIEKLLQLTPEQFSVFLENSKQDLLANLLSSGQLTHATALYVRFHEQYDQNPRYQAAIQNLLIRTHEKFASSAVLFKTDKKFQIDGLILKMILNTFIANPQSFVNMLDTHFVLAHEYFLKMSEEDHAALMQSAEQKGVRLVEKLIEMIALGAYGDRATKVDTGPLTKEPSDFESTMDLVTTRSVLDWAAGIRCRPNENYPVYESGNWTLVPEKLKDKKYSVGRIGEFFELYQEIYILIKSEEYLRSAGKAMIKAFAPFMSARSLDFGHNYSFINDICFGLLAHELLQDELKFFLNHSSTALRSRLLFSSQSGDIRLDLNFQQLLSPSYHACFYDLVKDFTLEDLNYLLQNIKRDRLEKFLSEVLKKLPETEGLFKSALHWLYPLFCSVEGKALLRKILGLLDKKMLNDLSEKRDGAYAAALHKLDPEFFMTNHVDFYLRMHNIILAIPKMGDEFLHNALSGSSAIAPPLVIAPATAPPLLEDEPVEDEPAPPYPTFPEQGIQAEAEAAVDDDEPPALKEEIEDLKQSLAKFKGKDPVGTAALILELQRELRERDKAHAQQHAEQMKLLIALAGHPTRDNAELEAERIKLQAEQAKNAKLTTMYNNLLYIKRVDSPIPQGRGRRNSF